MTTVADSHKSFDLLLHQAKIQSRSKHAHSLFIKVDQHVQKLLCAAENDYPNIDTLTALYKGDDADNRVIIGAGRGHGEPPLRRSANLLGDPAGKQYKQCDVPVGRRKKDHSPAR